LDRALGIVFVCGGIAGITVAQRDPDFFEILISQIAQDARVNAVLREALGILSQTERL